MVVTRWFGGTKLGVGGLMRAYGGAAGQALDRAEVLTVAITRRVALGFPYACSGAVQALLASAGLQPEESDFGAQVRLVVRVEEERLEGFLDELRERTAARAQWELLEA